MAHLPPGRPSPAAHLARGVARGDLRRLTDRHLFADPHFHHEYLLLARDHFEDLSPEDQTVLLGWVDAGPDPDLWRTDPRAAGSSEEYSDRWRLDRLAMLHESLPPVHLEEYQRLVSSLGPPEHPDFVVYLPAARTDPTTPRQADELHENDLDELVGFLASWTPTPGLGNPTVEGLARKLAAVVATEPVKFADAARLFRELDPAYVWAVLHGLREAAEGYRVRVGSRAGTGGVGRRRRPGQRLPLAAGPPGDGAPDLARSGPGPGRNSEPLPPEGLGGDPAPDRRSGPRGSRAAGSRPRRRDCRKRSRPVDADGARRGDARGDALRPVGEAGDRVQPRRPGAAVARGFDEMPEVRQVLEARLDPATETSPAIRAVYGRWFAFLLMLDNRWASGAVERIFPKDPQQVVLRDAAWEAHVSFSNPYDHLLTVIEEEYSRGVDLAGRMTERPPNTISPEDRLAEHLMVFYLPRQACPGSGRADRALLRRRARRPALPRPVVHRPEPEEPAGDAPAGCGDAYSGPVGEADPAGGGGR